MRRKRGCCQYGSIKQKIIRKKYHKNIYNQTITLRDREVTALVCEYKDDPRNSTIFVYGDLLVEVKGKPDVWTAEWFSSLSFESFYQ